MENVKVSTNAEQQHESKVNEAENFDAFILKSRSNYTHV